MVGIPAHARGPARTNGSAQADIHGLDFANLFGFNPEGPAPTFPEVVARVRRLRLLLHPDRLVTYQNEHNGALPPALTGPSAITFSQFTHAVEWLTGTAGHPNSQNSFDQRIAAVWAQARTGYRQTWDPMGQDPWHAPAAAKRRSPEVVIQSRAPLDIGNVAGAGKGTPLAPILLSSDEEEEEEGDDEPVVLDHAVTSGGPVRSGRTARGQGNGGPDQRFPPSSLHNLYALAMHNLSVIVGRVRNHNQQTGPGSPQYMVEASLDSNNHVNFRLTTRDLRDQRLPTWGSRATSLSFDSIRTRHGGEFLGVFANGDGSVNVANIRDFLFALHGRAARGLDVGRNLLYVDDPSSPFTIDSLLQDIDRFRQTLDGRAVFKRLRRKSPGARDKAPSAFDKGGRGGRGGRGGGGGRLGGGGGGGLLGSAGNPVTV